MTLSLTPNRKLIFRSEKDGINKDLETSFDESNSKGLLDLIKKRDLADQASSYFAKTIKVFLQDVLLSGHIESPEDFLNFSHPQDKLAKIIQGAPPFLGSEYFDQDFLSELLESVKNEVLNQAEKKDLRSFFKSHFPSMMEVGHVYFHLAENKKDQNLPFAFLATFSTRSDAGRVKHLPLSHAFKMYANTGQKLLLKLLKPLREASKKSKLIDELIETKKIYQPISWTPEQAFSFLSELDIYEHCGIIVRVPAWWNRKNQPKVKVQITVDSNRKNKVDFDSLLSFSAKLAIGNQALTAKEWKELSEANSRLVYLKGNWVQVDKEKIQQTLDHWNEIASTSKEEGVSFTSAMRLLAGSQISQEDKDRQLDSNWASVIAGKNLEKVLEDIRSPQSTPNNLAYLSKTLHADLRPYQAQGVSWLDTLSQLGAGGCLADDMGLGKTIQMIALLLLAKKRDAQTHSLLIMPTSLLNNWQTEVQKFAPTLKVVLFHGSTSPSPPSSADQLSKYDIALTSYASLKKYPLLQNYHWDFLVLDEAQAIKNHSSKQTKLVKKMHARVKFALTGTPIENQLSDLWSIFDFACPGLLGNESQFKKFTKQLHASEPPDYAPLRRLIKPYVLRRLKTDKSIIDDLPDKTVLKSFCFLSKGQAVLYQDSVEELAKILADDATTGMKRRGLILSYMLKFKQICNHPSQALNDGNYSVKNSGKLLRLVEICDEIHQRQEKVLVFTQFREIIPVLNQTLQEKFGRRGHTLHGGTHVKKRTEMVEDFQKESGAPYFIISLKAGGSGLNLTQANHVVHFDRWWNASVEEQATDRSFRIGQQKNIFVHKLICKGTIEEKIDAIIEEKRSLSQELVESNQKVNLVELSNDQILDMVKLDLGSTMNHST